MYFHTLYTIYLNLLTQQFLSKSRAGSSMPLFLLLQPPHHGVSLGSLLNSFLHENSTTQNNCSAQPTFCCATCWSSPHLSLTASASAAACSALASACPSTKRLKTKQILAGYSVGTNGIVALKMRHDHSQNLCSLFSSSCELS